MSSRKPPSCVYSGFWEEDSPGHSVPIWLLTAAWTGKARILCLDLLLTQAPRICLSSGA